VEIDKIRSRIRELRRADRDRQKAIRAGLRSMGFRISDYTHDQQGFTVADLDALIKRGVIATVDDTGDTAPEDDAEPAVASASSAAPAPPATTTRTETAGRRDHAHAPADVQREHVAAALAALTGNRHVLAVAHEHVPDRPGLYAIYGQTATWTQLGLGEPPDDRPLYVGKAEASLVSRDLRTHFGDGRTGQSTVRRSIAALLHDTLGLRGIPRNPTKPAYFANYGLSPAHDAALTSWMREHLQLAFWIKPNNVPLQYVELQVLAALVPPLNLKDVITPWRGMLKNARAVMAAEARTWASDRGK
jgi:hypothetical protein